MATHSLHPLAVQRRTVIKALAWAAVPGLGPSATRVWAQNARSAPGDDALSPAGAAWRAMSRVGYGPTPALAQTVVDLPSAKAWAMAQLDLACLEAQRPPRRDADLTEFNAPLPALFDGVRLEREARKDRKADPAGDFDASKIRRMDFTGDKNPLYFSRTVAQQTAAWRLLSASQPEMECPLLARLTEFWFNHLNVSTGKGSVRPFVGHYLVNVARAHALGRFEDLLLASARHPAMLFYLDQVQSAANGPPDMQGVRRGLNENYARELMELHTLGVNGGYGQGDVLALARVLTGWTVAPSSVTGFRFAPQRHDAGSKMVLGQEFPRGWVGRGEREGEDAIRMLARHPSTAQRVSLRLAQFFISDQPPKELVKRLSATYQSSQGDLRLVMQTLLQAPEFWSAHNRLFKTPLDFAVSALAAVQTAPAGGQAIDNGRRGLLLTLGFLANAGQPLHGWQTPDGYKFDGATWLVPEALTRRADFALALARQTPELPYLKPFLSEATLETIARERPAIRTALMLASPDFMSK